VKKLTLVLLAALIGTSAGAGGIGVTNGRQMFALAGLTVQYAPELTLKEISKSAFSISNEKLVQPSERVSKVGFTVAKVPGKTLSDVKRALQKKFPAKQILAMEQPGAKGFFWEERSSSSIIGHYDLLTSNGDLVDIELEAFSAGDGLRWVAPIVHSVVYDASGPVMHELRLENRTWEAGSTQKVWLRITDDYSGVKPEIGYSFEALDPKGLTKKAYFYGEATLTPKGNDWYTIEVPVGSYTPNRKFRFSAFNLLDNANNRRRLEAGENDAYYTYVAAMPKDPVPRVRGPRVPSLRVRVINRGAEDSVPPQALGFRPDNTVWEAGSTHRVYFKLADDVSGVELNDRLVSISQPCSTFQVNGARVCSGVAGVFVPYRAEGNDWYSAEYKVGQYLPSGEYQVGAIVVQDKAGNNVMTYFEDDMPTAPGLVPVFKIRIQNNGLVDTSRPNLLEWKIDSSHWKSGGEGKIYVRATDEGTGLNLQSMFVSFEREDGSDSAFFASDSKTNQSEGNGWYSMKVKVDEFRQAGRYFPSFVAIRDLAGNETYVDCQDGGACQVRNGHAIQMTPLQVEVIR
jgi:hypothetical protein